MKRMISMGSIDQFKTIVKNVKWQAQYQGKDMKGNPILNKDAKAPIIRVKYSEKTHGSNMGVCFNNETGFYVQSKKNIITPEKDNAGCAFAAEGRKDAWMNIINELAEFHNIDLNKNIITVYAEWCGGNIQKKANVSGEDKMAIIFDYFKVSPLEPNEDEIAEWLETKTEQWVDSTKNRIFNVNNFSGAVNFIDIDFERPDLAQNELIRIMKEFEKNSPIARYFNKPDNIGEGIVCSFSGKDGERNVFKVKGEEHSKGLGKIKTLKPVNSVLEQKKIDFVNEFACTESRLSQMWAEIIHSTYNGDESLMQMKDIGNFLKLVMKDVLKEESDTIKEKGLEPKPLNGLIAKVSKDYFINKLNTI